MNRTPEILFALLIAMMIVVVTFWWIEPTPQGQGFNHRAYPEETLQQAPESWERHRSVIAGATCFGALACLISVVAMALGLNQRGRSGLAVWWLMVAGAIFTGLFVMVVMLYTATIGDRPPLSGPPLSGPPLSGPPLSGPPSLEPPSLWKTTSSTAVMLLVFAPSPLVLAFLYMIMFRRWILSSEEEARFHALVANRRAKESR